MAIFTRASNLIALFSRLISRSHSRAGRLGERASTFGGLLALAMLFAASSAVGTRQASGPGPANDGRSVHAVPHLQSNGLHRAEDGPRVSRRPAPHIDPPLAAGAGPALVSWPVVVTVAPLRVACRATALGARGYDATAPPLLC